MYSLGFKHSPAWRTFLIGFTVVVLKVVVNRVVILRVVGGWVIIFEVVRRRVVVLELVVGWVVIILGVVVVKSSNTKKYYLIINKIFKNSPFSSHGAYLFNPPL
jgi:hypothetical protein